MDFWRSLDGVLTLQVTTADPIQFLKVLNGQDLPIEELQYLDELTLELQMKRSHYRRFLALVEKNGAEVRILRKYGVFWLLRDLMHRPVLVAGILSIILLTLYLPTRILFYRVEGNVNIPTRQILAIGEENGLSFGTRRRDVRSERVKNCMLKAIPELEWVGINTSGCVVTISVRERQEGEAPQNDKTVTSIVAVKDGIINEITATAGTASVKAGDAVTAGQVLISGYTDCGLSVRAERAKGEVYATTNYNMTFLLPEKTSQFGQPAGERVKISLIIGKNRINFKEHSGNLDASCVKMYEEDYITLPGGFVLPICIVTERNLYYEDHPTEENPSDEAALRDFAQSYLRRQLIAGTISGCDEHFFRSNGVLFLEGSYTCLEMIGREQIEEIIKP